MVSSIPVSPRPETRLSKNVWAGGTPRFFRHEQVAKSGVLQPNSVPFRGHMNRFVVRNLFAFGHLLDRVGEREGDGRGELCLSCTRHLAALQLANRIEAL